MRRDDADPRARPSAPGDRIRAYLYDVRSRDTRAADLPVAQPHPQFMAKLFGQEVPEIYDNVVTIKAVARRSGLARQGSP